MKKSLNVFSVFLLLSLLSINKVNAEQDNKVEKNYNKEFGFSPFTYTAQNYGLGFYYEKSTKSLKDRWFRLGVKFNFAAYNKISFLMSSEGRNIDSYREYSIGYKYYLQRTDKIEWAIGHTEHLTFGNLVMFYPYQANRRMIRRFKRNGEVKMGAYSEWKLGAQFDTYFNYLIADKVALNFQVGLGFYLFDAIFDQGFFGWPIFPGPRLWTDYFTPAYTGSVALVYRF